MTDEYNPEDNVLYHLRVIRSVLLDTNTSLQPEEKVQGRKRIVEHVYNMCKKEIKQFIIIIRLRRMYKRLEKKYGKEEAVGVMARIVVACQIDEQLK